MRPVDGPQVVWAVRHGLSAANEAFARAAASGALDAGIVGPDSEVELSPVGREQAVLLGRWMAADRTHRPDIVFGSPYLRARQTVELALGRLGESGDGIPVRLDPRLGDRRTGVLELLTPAAVAARFPAEVRRLERLGAVEHRPEGGESLRDVAERMRDFWAEVSSTQIGKRVLVVAHDAPILMLRAITESLSDRDVVSIINADPVRNAAISSWHPVGGTLRLTGYNDVDHLSDPTGQ